MREPQYGLLPSHLIGGFRRYIKDGIEPGGCVRAILENDLTEAFARADDITTANMRDIVAFVYNELPAASHGSPEKVKAWLAGDEE